MAVEYLYDCIRATVGDDMKIEAEIYDDDGNALTEECRFRLYDKTEELISITEGTYADNMWTFVVPIKELPKGQYLYSVCYKGANICFKQPIYLV